MLCAERGISQTTTAKLRNNNLVFISGGKTGNSLVAIHSGSGEHNAVSTIIYINLNRVVAQSCPRGLSGIRRDLAHFNGSNTTAERVKR